MHWIKHFSAVWSLPNNRGSQSYHKSEALCFGHPMAAGDLNRASRRGEVPAEGGETLDLSPPRHTKTPHTQQNVHYSSKFIANPMTTWSQRGPSSLWMGLTLFHFSLPPLMGLFGILNGTLPRRSWEKAGRKKKKNWMQQFSFCFLTPLSFLPTIFQLEGVMC